MANFGAINAPANVLDGDNATCCGSAWDASVEQSVTLTFAGTVELDKVLVSCKDELAPADGGPWGTYDIYALSDNSQTLLGSVEAWPDAQTFVPKTTVKANGIKLVITSWNASGWAAIADVWVYGSAAEACAHENTSIVKGVAATCTQTGLSDYRVCADCGIHITEQAELPATGHTFENGVCTACGEAEDSQEPVAPPEVPDTIIKVVGVTSAKAGDTVDVQVLISGNPGMAFLALTPEYNDKFLTLVAVSNGKVFSDLDSGMNLIFSDSGNSYVDDELVTLTFQISADAQEGDYDVSLILQECYNDNAETVACDVYGATIAVVDVIYGDVNGDGIVNGKDVVILRQYMANYDYDIDSSSVVLGPAA